ncbi:serine protease [uncultured Roseobacter sp.]|uniref:S1 family peptidase n=1 Tax=uncultured Roseobacter sp. TaxID=114847 RepID=UPI002603DA13|nr:serine protease [uncultured Roseobacter sp.]
MFFGDYSCVAARVLAFARQVMLVALLLFALGRGAEAAEPPRSLSYHATLLNGAITGSAFMIADGVAVTNAHVLGRRGIGEVVTLLAPGKPRGTARILAISPRMDLAILSIDPDLLPVAPAGRARDARGDPIYAVGIVADGNPRRRLVISGTVASERRTLAPFGRGVIASMPRVKRGFSGGPVFDRNGQLVGMVAALREGREDNRRTREAFILSADAIRAEVGRLQPALHSANNARNALSLIR